MIVVSRWKSKRKKPMTQTNIASDMNVEKRAERFAAEAVRNMRMNQLGELWAMVERGMTEARLMAESTKDSSDEFRARLAATMLSLRDEFIIVHAYTEAMLPTPKKPGTSQIAREDLDFYEAVNNRLGVMENEYRRFAGALPTGFLTDFPIL